MARGESTGKAECGWQSILQLHGPHAESLVSLPPAFHTPVPPPPPWGGLLFLPQCGAFHGCLEDCPPGRCPLLISICKSLHKPQAPVRPTVTIVM